MNSRIEQFVEKSKFKALPHLTENENFGTTILTTCGVISTLEIVLIVWLLV